MTEHFETMNKTVKAIADREGKYLTFAIANEEYGISILKIKEIPPKADRSPLFPKHRSI